MPEMSVSVRSCCSIRSCEEELAIGSGRKERAHRLVLHLELLVRICGAVLVSLRATAVRRVGRKAFACVQLRVVSLAKGTQRVFTYRIRRGSSCERPTYRLHLASASPFLFLVETKTHPNLILHPLDKRSSLPHLSLRNAEPASHSALLDGLHALVQVLDVYFER